MEENKNQAINKTEEIVDSSKTVETKASKPKSKAKTKNSAKRTNKNKATREQTAETKRKLQAAKLKAKEDRKKAKLQKREELKSLAQQKKQEKLKAHKAKVQAQKRAKLQKQQALKEKREDLKRLKLQKKEERIKRRELLKKESKAERQKRIATEKRQKLALRREKLADKKAKRLERIEERKSKRQFKRQERQDRRKNKRGVGGWVAAVISLGSAVLILGGLLTLSLFTPLDEYMMVNTAEQRSFYDLVGYVDNMDVNLSKLVVSNDEEEQQKLLGEVRVQSSLAMNSISTLALHDEDKYLTTKFINQVGDFSKYLNNKLIEGEKLTDSDIEILNNLYQINTELKNSLGNISMKIDEKFDFRSIYEGKKDNLIIAGFDDLESNAAEYPHMIYDGAFSDSVTGTQAKSLEGLSEITKSEAEENFRKYFSDYNLNEVTLTGETKGKAFETYNFDAVNDDGVKITAQITKVGGKLVLFNYFKDCKSDAFDQEQCEQTAIDFLEKVGYKGLKAVWMADDNHVVTFNFASVVDGVICYNDLIKVNVCKERGIVSGIEASSYIMNNTQRQPFTAEISLEEAQQKVSGKIEIQSSRLAIIPKGTSSEILAYEFTGDNNGNTYYIYINAKTGKEADIFKVVKTTEGTLLM